MTLRLSERLKMNQVKAFAKTLISILGIYWLIMLAINAVKSLFTLSVMIFVLDANNKKRDIPSMFIELFGFLILFILILGILRKRNKIAEKIAGIEGVQVSLSQVDFVPIVFRLACVLVGMFCFYEAASILLSFTMSSACFQLLGEKMNIHSPFLASYWYLFLITTIFVIAGIYFICGAPHFVRWHIKKTLEMCENS
jgi:hypothetical protein